MKEFYARVLANGDIYRADYEGLYCVNCEEYKVAPISLILKVMGLLRNRKKKQRKEKKTLNILLALKSDSYL